MALDDLCKCGHKNGDHYSKPGWPACSQCTTCKGFDEEEKDPLIRPDLDWHAQRKLWNENFQCSRESCRDSLLHRSGELAAAQHRHTGLLYCRHCCRMINDYNPMTDGALVEWVWSCAEEGCMKLVRERGAKCKDHEEVNSGCE